MSARPILTPSQLNALARSVLEDSFALVEVEGELCNVSRPASGHLYFGLKDARAQIRCALFKPKSQWLRFKPMDGLQVIARGRVTLYEPRGDYQLILEHLEPAGEGALQRQFEELKRRLAAEGLFAAERKRPIPRWLGRLGVISSPRGAAIHDVLSVLGRRFPLLEVELLPVPVQGDGAAAVITRMLERADASGRYDALLLTRGGGSLDDLQAFNDEALARAIAACRTPVACAIGHEIDHCIAEYVADLRAPTPSAAAESLVPDRAELAARLRALHERQSRCRRRALETLQQRLDHVVRRLHAQRPQARLQRDRRRLVELGTRLQQRAAQRLQLARATLERQQHALARAHPRHRLGALAPRPREQLVRLRSAIALRLQRDSRAVAALARALQAVSPLATLARGYAIVQAADDGPVLRSVRQFESGRQVVIRLDDGRVDARIDGLRPAGDNSD